MYEVNELINKIRINTDDNDNAILTKFNMILEELANIDVLEIVKAQRANEQRRFEEWMNEPGECVRCEKSLPKLELYSYRARTLEKVRYHQKFNMFYPNDNGMCYDCKRKDIANHTSQCIDCGKDFYRYGLNSERCGDCQSLADLVSPQRSRAIKAGCTASLTGQEWVETLKYFENKCAYCGGEFEAIEHFTPIIKGGGTDIDNCIPACQRCNSSKNSLDGRMQKEELAERLCISVDRLYAIEQYLESR